MGTAGVNRARGAVNILHSSYSGPEVPTQQIAKRFYFCDCRRRREESARDGRDTRERLRCPSCPCCAATLRLWDVLQRRVYWRRETLRSALYSFAKLQFHHLLQNIIFRWIENVAVSGTWQIDWRPRRRRRRRLPLSFAAYGVSILITAET